MTGSSSILDVCVRWVDVEETAVLATMLNRSVRVVVPTVALAGKASPKNCDRAGACPHQMLVQSPPAFGGG